MKKRFSEEQIIGFLRQAEAGLPVKECVVGMGSRKPAITCGAASSAG